MIHTCTVTPTVTHIHTLTDSVHLDREDGEPNTLEWCEPLKETLAECFEQIESIYA